MLKDLLELLPATLLMDVVKVGFFFPDAFQIMPKWMKSKSWFLLWWCSPNNAKMDSKRLLSWCFPNNAKRFLCFQLLLHANWIKKKTDSYYYYSLNDFFCSWRIHTAPHEFWFQLLPTMQIVFILPIKGSSLSSCIHNIIFLLALQLPLSL